MANLFAKARDWLPAQVQAAAGVSVTYTRAAGGTISLEPWVGRTLFSGTVEGGARVQWGDRDYIVRRDELVSGGSEIPPALGDRLTEVIGGVSTTFEVQNPDTGEPAWRWADAARSMYRLHVKKVG